MLADADEQRAALPCADDTSAFARRNDGNRVRTLESRDRMPDRREQITAALAMPVRMDEVRDDLGVGLRPENVAARPQRVAQLLVILDDAIVNDGDLAAGQMRMRVVGRGRPVRGPARV